MGQRFVDPRNHNLPGPGWCETQPLTPPTRCSWHGVDLETKGVKNYVAWCRLCDTPQPPRREQVEYVLDERDEEVVDDGDSCDPGA